VQLVHCTDTTAIRAKWSKLRTTYMRRRKRRTVGRSGSTARDDVDDAKDLAEEGDDTCPPNVTDAMDFILPYTSP